MTIATYTVVVSNVDGDRYVHGNNPWGFTETNIGSSDFPEWTLTVPHDDGDLTAREGDWVLVDADAVNHVCPNDLFAALFAQ